MAETTGKQIAVRLPLELYEALQADAVANGRTVTQSVRFLLRKAITSRSEGSS